MVTSSHMRGSRIRRRHHGAAFHAPPLPLSCVDGYHSASSSGMRMTLAAIAAGGLRSTDHVRAMALR
jgi:hypothetical protein